MIPNGIEKTKYIKEYGKYIQDSFTQNVQDKKIAVIFNNIV